MHGVVSTIVIVKKKKNGNNMQRVRRYTNNCIYAKSIIEMPFDGMEKKKKKKRLKNIVNES